MKLFTGSLAAGLALLAGAAQAQAPGRYTAASDFDAPYAEAPHAIPGPQYGAGPRYGYGPGPGLLPSTEVYSVLRDNGFSPLGIPRLRGFVYTIAVIDRGGEDGRLVIDARNGRIIRFLPAYRTGDNDYEDQSALRGPVMAQPPQAQRRGRGAGSSPGCAAAVTAGSCCEPLGAAAEGQPDRRPACAGAGPAGGSARSQSGRS